MNRCLRRSLPIVVGFVLVADCVGAQAQGAFVKPVEESLRPVFLAGPSVSSKGSVWERTRFNAAPQAGAGLAMVSASSAGAASVPERAARLKIPPLPMAAAPSIRARRQCFGRCACNPMTAILGVAVATALITFIGILVGHP